jgi:hypothetical protein
VVTVDIDERTAGIGGRRQIHGREGEIGPSLLCELDVDGRRTGECGREAVDEVGETVVVEVRDLDADGIASGGDAGGVAEGLGAERGRSGEGEKAEDEKALQEGFREPVMKIRVEDSLDGREIREETSRILRSLGSGNTEVVGENGYSWSLRNVRELDARRRGVHEGAAGEHVR